MSLVMQSQKDNEDRDYISYTEKINKEYQEAVNKGFSGTKEEYLEIRSYT